MNKLLTGIVLLCFSVVANAQGKEIWACQLNIGHFLHWEGSGWTRWGDEHHTKLLTIDGSNSKITYELGTELPMLCHENDMGHEVCLNDNQGQFSMLNPNTGTLVMTSMLAAIVPPAVRGNTDVITQIYNCTKF